MKGTEPGEYCIQRIIHGGTIERNGLMQRSRTMLRDLMIKTLSTSTGRTVGAETQKINNCLNSWVNKDTAGDIDAKQSS